MMNNDTQFKLEKEYEQNLSSLDSNDPEYKTKVLNLKKQLVKDKIKAGYPKFLAYIMFLAGVWLFLEFMGG